MDVLGKGMDLLGRYLNAVPPTQAQVPPAMVPPTGGVSPQALAPRLTRAPKPPDRVPSS